jgi:hypothetical protein
MRGASHTHQGLVQGRMSLWLELSRHKDDHHTTDPETATAGSEDMDGGDAAAIQNDNRLNTADRMDLIAYQVIPEEVD